MGPFTNRARTRRPLRHHDDDDDDDDQGRLNLGGMPHFAS